MKESEDTVFMKVSHFPMEPTEFVFGFLDRHANIFQTSAKQLRVGKKKEEASRINISPTTLSFLYARPARNDTFTFLSFIQ